MKIERKNKANNEISTSSMPDIIFMLLIFFMVTTVMREFEGLDVLIPSAKMIEKLESKRNTVHIWVSKEGMVSINDKIISNFLSDPSPLASIMYGYMLDNNKTIVSLKSDKNTSMRLISEIHTQLREAQAVRVSYSAKTKE